MITTIKIAKLCEIFKEAASKKIKPASTLQEALDAIITIGDILEKSYKEEKD